MDERGKLYDEWLVARSQAGDATALNELMRRWCPRLHRQARALTGREDAAWDVTQEAAMAIAGRLDRLDDPVAFPAWAFRILHRKAIRWIRNQQRQRRRDQTFQEQAARDHPPRHEDPREAALAEALAGLPPESRALMTLHYFEGLSLGEVAEVLGIPPGTVKSRLYYCRQHLRRHMEEIGL